MISRYSWVLRLLVTAALLWAVLRNIPVAQVVPAMLSADPGYVALGLICSPLVMIIEAVRFRLLLAQHGMTLTAWQILTVNLGARFYGLFVPGLVSGAVFRWYRFAQGERKWGEVLACIVFGRLLDTAMLVILGLGFWMLARPTGAGAAVGAVLFGVFGLLLAVHFMIVFGARAVAGTSTALERLRVPRAALEKFKRLAIAAVEGYRLSQGVIGPMGGLSLMVHLVGMVSFLCLARSLHIGISFIEIGWISSVVGILLMLPISVAGLGVREGSLLVLLPAYGVADSDAVALSLLMFVAGIAMAVAGGLVELRQTLRNPAARQASQRGSPHG